MKIYGSRDSFYQWDVNQRITSTKIKEGDEVHFANDRSGEAFVVKAYKHNHVVVADVPNILLQQTNKILVYRYVTDGASEHTVNEKVFDVLARPKPSDYIYTETEILSYETLDERITKLEKNGGSGGGSGGSGSGGATFTPHVSPEGVLSWSNDGGLDNPEAVDMVRAVLSALPDNREVAY